MPNQRSWKMLSYVILQWNHRFVEFSPRARQWQSHMDLNPGRWYSHGRPLLNRTYYGRGSWEQHQEQLCGNRFQSRHRLMKQSKLCCLRKWRILKIESERALCVCLKHWETSVLFTSKSKHSLKSWRWRRWQ